MGQYQQSYTYMNVMYNIENEPNSLAERIRDKAKIWADIFSENTDSNNGQLKRFFNEFISLSQKIESDVRDLSASFNKILPLIYLMKAKATYFYNRKFINESFKEFICQNIDRIRTKEDFDEFIIYFEAIIGYLKVQN